MTNNQFNRRDDFEHWLASMDDFLEHLYSRMPAATRDRLDLTPASLDALESWILERFPHTTAMLAAEEGAVVNGLACYIGETIRKARGGKWDIRFDDPKFAYYGLPILTGTRKNATPECPHSLATASADRRSGKYLRTVLENMPAF